jgi:diguanylate cyclase (GGDEF)-like protein
MLAAGIFLSVVAATLLARELPAHESLLPVNMGAALFFYLFSLFTITAGYSNRSFGYVSMDRVGQISTLLIFGPFHGALINGAASFTFAWFRLFQGVPLGRTLNAVLINTGMMSIMSLAGGHAYLAAGGVLPVDGLSPDMLLPLAATLVTMQLINELLIAALFLLRGERPGDSFVWSATGIELLSGIIGVLVAVMYRQQDLALFSLFVAVLVLGMRVQRQYALIRQNLEVLVEQRTAELEDAGRELLRQAVRDDLTGLFNRRYANDYLEQEILRCRRYHHTLSVAMLDVDCFKQINDRFLHETGDRVLRRLAEILVEHVRKTDLVARYGGEEFLLCFPETDAASACKCCEELRAMVEREDWEAIQAGMQVTVSMGVAQTGGSDSLSELLRAADHNLYRAKDAGRNQVVCGAGSVSRGAHS